MTTNKDFTCQASTGVVEMSGILTRVVRVRCTRKDEHYEVIDEYHEWTPVFGDA